MILLGIGAGAYGVIVGAGGGFILSPSLLLLLPDLHPESVAGTVLTSTAILSIIVTWQYHRDKVLDYRSGLLFGCAAIPGAVIGVFAVKAVPPSAFQILLGTILILLAVQLAITALMPQRAKAPRQWKLLNRTVRKRKIITSQGDTYEYEFDEAPATVFNMLLGFVSSFFGIGGGFIRTPLLIVAFGFPVRIATATSVFAIAFYGSAGAITHGFLGHIQWFPTLVFTGIGMAIGGMIGARLSGRLRGPWVMRLLLIGVLALGLRLIWEGLSAI